MPGFSPSGVTIVEVLDSTRIILRLLFALTCMLKCVRALCFCD